MVDPECSTSPISSPVTLATPPFAGVKPSRRFNIRRSILNSCWCLEIDTSSTETPACSQPPRQLSLARKIAAEFIGTLILIFFSMAAAMINDQTGGAITFVGVAACTGLSVMAIIISTGHISGAHINPSVTVAYAALRRLPWKHVPMYVGAQVAASVCAAFAATGMFPPAMGGGVTVPIGGWLRAFLIELVISFNLMFVVTAVATDTRAIGELAGIAVGATVTLNVLIAGKISGASMNPARTLGSAVAANNYESIWVYLTAPFLGALAGAGAYSAIKLPEDHNQQQGLAIT